MVRTPMIRCLTVFALYFALTVPRASQAQSAPAAAADQTIEVNGIQLHYRAIGTGPALLMIHGLTWAGEYWNPLLPTLSRDHRLIVVDLPGHGRSTGHPSPWSYRQIASDTFALLDRLGIQRVQAVGHSAGGCTLVYMATQQPARLEAMVLIAGGHRLLPSARKRLHDLTYDDFDAAARSARLPMLPGGEAQLRSLVDSLRSTADDYEDLSFTPERLSQIRARTLLVWGDRDPTFPIEVAMELYRSIPNAALWVVPFQKHFPIWPDQGGSPEAARDFPEIVMRFLNDTK